jgi:hypothetical protein
MSEKKYYVVGVTSPELWDQVHNALTQDGTLDDNIPSRSIQCTNEMDHSPTRAVYLMTDEEANLVRSCPDVKFVDLDKSQYPEQFPPRPDELHATALYRYTSTVKNYKNFTGLLPDPATLADANRAGYQLLRCAQYDNPWQGQSVQTVINSRIPNSTTGKNIDVIVGDDGCWFGHQEFQRVITGGAELPRDYVGGNKLPGNGTCDLLDVVLEGPYYIDPDWFNADPGVRLATRWDGTVVPVESVARAWWSTASQRSAQFAGAGTVAVPGTYTRANCNGNNSTQSAEGNHGTACAGQAYGRTQGWAYNANKWFIDAYGSFGFGINVDLYFDVVKIFHLNKPINPLYGTQDPTINSNSWGFRATIPSTGFYYFRQGTTGSGGVAYSGTKPEFMRYLGSTGDGGRAKGEMVPNNLTAAGDELIASGVIFVAAAGNSNQQQVSSDNANYNNYWSSSAATPLASATHDEFGSTCYNTTSRRGFPQQIGKYLDGGNVIYPTINIGALDDDNQPDGKERKVNYSDMGNEIDCYTPGDGTLVSNRLYAPQFLRYGSYAGAVSVGTGFTGVCSASAVLPGTGSIVTASNTGNRITTSSGTATVTNIPSQLFGAFGTMSTTPTTGDQDDGFWALNLPFNFSFNGVTYNQVFIGANTYITFGAGAQDWSNLSASVPPLPKIMMCAADNSCQTVYYGTEGSAPNRTYRVRYQGTWGRTPTFSSPNMIYEITFYEAVPNQIDLQIGTNFRGSGIPLTFFDCRFSGTSSACPTAAGLIACKMETNRNWGWQDVRTWMQGQNEQSAVTFYQGPDPQTANSADWVDLNSLMGGTRKVLYQDTVEETVGISGAGLTLSGAGLSISFS